VAGERGEIAEMKGMPAHSVAHRGGRDLKASSNGAALMSVQNTHPCRQIIRRDNGRFTAYDQAQAALEIALYQRGFGTADTLAWIAAGAPEDGASHADNDLYQTARNIVDGNCGTIKAGDALKLLEHVLRRHRLSREGADE
jgi:hypothetical protein